MMNDDDDDDDDDDDWTCFQQGDVSHLPEERQAPQTLNFPHWTLALTYHYNHHDLTSKSSQIIIVIIMTKKSS